jgi:thiamine biosynthesis lipoprotein
MIKKLYPVLLVLLFSQLACTEKKAEPARFNGFTQGTTYSIVYENNKNIDPQDLKIEVEKILHSFDMSLSVYIDSSIISRINRNEEVAVDTFFTGVFNESAEISAMTDGAFDITVGPLVDAWGFGPDGRRSFKESNLDSLMQFIGMSKVALVNGFVKKSDPRIKLDVNAIAQGYSVDVVCRYFDNLGLKDYLVEIGGEVRGKGTKDGELWKIGIDKPIDNNMFPGENLQAVIKISDKALATSGNYRKFYIENGVKYSHEINPLTGYPARNTLLSATILADKCGMADGIATACMVMGTKKSIDFINKHPEFSAYFVYSDEKGNFITWTSPGLKKYLEEE